MPPVTLHGTARDFMDQVRLFGRLPQSHHSGAVERILRQTVGACEGRWEIRIRHFPRTPWCLLRIKRPSDGFKSTLLLDLYEEPLEQVATSLSDALKHADDRSRATPSRAEKTAY
jgi:hypothetical protein